MEIPRATDSEYIEMTNRGLGVNMDSVYDVIPADYGVQMKPPSRKIAGIDNEMELYLSNT
jgi:hypothetical protein